MRRARLLESLPVLAAFAVHGLSLHRWVEVIPAGLALAAVIARDRAVPHRSGLMLLFGLAGGAVGAALLLVHLGDEHGGAFPPAVLSPACGALVGLAAYCAATRNSMYAWTYAWLLAALSEASRERAVMVAGVAMCAATLVAFSAGAPYRQRVDLRSALGWLLFVGLLMGGAWGVSRAVWGSEGTIMGLLMEVVGDHSPGGFGLTDSLFGGPISQTRLSSRPLFTVSGRVPHFLRTGVFDDFDGYSWHSSSSGDPVATRPTLDRASPAAASTETVLEFAEELGPHLPVPAGVRSVEGVRATPAGQGLMHAERLKDLAVKLHVEGAALEPEAPRPEDAALPDDLRTELLPLAEGIVAGAPPDPASRARAVERYFAEGFSYALDVDLTSRTPGHPVTVLIREHRAAYCAYFASAMAAVMRALGVPARVVGGYVPEERNPLSSQVTVRERDAHAWVEVYLPDQGGFVPFDPTPWRARDAALDISARLGWVGGAWELVARTLSGSFARPMATLVSVARSPLSWLAVALLAVRVFWRRRSPRAARVRGAMESEDAALRGAHQSFLEQLARRGVRLRPSDTDDDAISQLEQAAGRLAATQAAAFVAIYRDMRFGAASVQPDALRRALQALAERPEAPNR